MQFKEKKTSSGRLVRSSGIVWESIDAEKLADFNHLQEKLDHTEMIGKEKW